MGMSAQGGQRTHSARTRERACSPQWCLMQQLMQQRWMRRRVRPHHAMQTAAAAALRAACVQDSC